MQLLILRVQFPETIREIMILLTDPFRFRFLLGCSRILAWNRRTWFLGEFLSFICFSQVLVSRSFLGAGRGRRRRGTSATRGDGFICRERGSLLWWRIGV